MNTETLSETDDVLSLVHQNAVEVWGMPKNKAINLLPEKEMKNIAIQFYKCANRYYPDEILVDDALDMIKNGAKFFERVNIWFENESKQ